MCSSHIISTCRLFDSNVAFHVSALQNAVLHCTSGGSHQCFHVYMGQMCQKMMFMSLYIYQQHSIIGHGVVAFIDGTFQYSIYRCVTLVL